MALAQPALEHVADADMTSGELARFLTRLGLQGELAPTKDTLFLAHRRFFERIPFENLSVFTSESISLDLPAIVDKVCGIDGRSNRGGYCYELNKLFAAAMAKLGFALELKSARVHLDDGETPRTPYRPPPTHIAAIVRADDELYLCDVGFGRTALYEPIVLASEAVHRNGHTRVQLRRAPMETPLGFHYENRQLWFQKEGEWKRGYSFSESEGFSYVDCVGPNLSVCAHPSSTFCQVAWVEARTAAEHWLLFGLRFTHESHVSGEEAFEVQSPEHLAYLLKQHFGIIVSEQSAIDVFAVSAMQNIDAKWTRLAVAREPHRAPVREYLAAVAGRGGGVLGAVWQALASRESLCLGVGLGLGLALSR
eukprot:CAMPEP_0118879818 /NCGR_PEP_ID=MMETSP1163-20130328/19524_1 /TAXON_ID=124430 /ORGANISM="Phaeomonas parva, Strain CCMP2877" /LENGTH=365 /DNA_ID=CAMNT_0006816055 /DNA_START=214 /DNA_END=1307 /DNA_ORIENTATION=+